MPAEQQSKLNAFASLKWYDSFIEFLFRFVAKTSEPLLALGIVISAVDFLTKGALLSHNPSLTEAWAWCQAIAIEASSGVVFVYALQSFKDRDNIKGRLYLALSVLLAFTGGAMLLLQLLATTASTSETALPLWVFYALAVLRVVVSVSYVYMCRAKHIRFTDLSDAKEDINHEDALSALAEQVRSLAESMVQVTSTVTEVKTTVTQITAASLPALSVEKVPLQIEAPANDQKIDEPIFMERFQSKEQVIATILQRIPGASPEQVAQEANCTLRTAQKWMSRVQVTR